jgi:hypothetical protein
MAGLMNDEGETSAENAFSETRFNESARQAPSRALTDHCPKVTKRALYV